MSERKHVCAAFHRVSQTVDTLAAHVNDLTDAIAERATALGGVVGAPVQAIAAQTSLEMWPMNLSRDAEVIRMLAERFAVVANSARPRSQPLPARTRTHRICSPKHRACWTKTCGSRKSISANKGSAGAMGKR